MTTPHDETGLFLQPAYERDLQRWPPETAVCGRVRSWLRDYVDGDLPGQQAEALEEHVSGCRRCGSALSRVEFELMHVRLALQAERTLRTAPESGPGEHFTMKVMARIAAEVQREELAERQPSGTFTERVMETVQAESDVVARRSAARRKLLFAAALFLGSLVLFLATLPESKRDGIPVLQARAAWWMDGDTPYEIRPGSTLGDRLTQGAGEMVAVRTGEDGLLQLVWPLESGRPDRTDPGSTEERTFTGQRGEVALMVESASQLRISPSRLELEAGSLALQAAEATAVYLADGTEVRMQPGSYRLQVDMAEQPDSSLVGTRHDLLAKLTVVEGRAEIWRGGQAHAVVGGRIAHFGSRLAVRMDAIVTDSMMTASRDRWVAIERNAAAPRVPDTAPGYLAQLIEAGTDRPAAGAQVSMQTFLGRVDVQADGMGRVVLPDLLAGAESRTGNQLMVLRASAGPFVLAPRSTVWRAPDVGEIGQTLILQPARRLAGAIVAERASDTIRLLPCIVDEALHRIEVVGGAQPVVDGRFDIRGLPDVLGPQQSVVLVALRAQRVPVVCYASDSRRQQQSELLLRLRLPRNDERVFELGGGGTGTARRVTLLCPVHGLPAIWSPVRVPVDSNGVVRMEVPAGYGRAVLLLDKSDPPRAVGPVHARASASFASLRVGSVPDVVGLEGALGERFDSVVRQPFGAEVRSNITVQDPVRGQAGGAGSVLFLRSQSGWDFLGVFDGAVPVPIGRRVEEKLSLVAVAPDGRTGSLRLGAGTRPANLELVLNPLTVVHPAAEVRALVDDGATLIRVRRSDGFELCRSSFGDHFVVQPGVYTVAIGDAEMRLDATRAGEVTLGR